MATRFDLEEQILSFSRIIEDIDELNLDNLSLQKITNYYKHRFDVLWDTFDEFIRTDHLASKNIPGEYLSMEKLKTVTRLEIIDEKGRSYTKYGILNKSFSLQDDNRTLKIFLDLTGEATSEDIHI